MTVNKNNLTGTHNQRGIALVVVLAMLMVLSALAYTLTLKVWAYQRRTQYMIDYQDARYACDSAIKYAVAMLKDINEPVAIARPNEPDFSDLFVLDETQHRLILEEWAEELTAEQAAKYKKKAKEYLKAVAVMDVNDPNSINDPNQLTSEEIVAQLESSLDEGEIIKAENLEIPGPYGPPWPLVAEPLNIMIGNATVTIEIHDENAKYPIGWAMLTDPTIRRQIEAGFEGLCEWMDMNSTVISEIEEQLDELNEAKEYKLEFKDITKTEREWVTAPRTQRRRGGGRRRVRRVQNVVSKTPAIVHLSDFARLTHSSLLNTEALARPTIVADDRKESALKYISLWPINTININTAPRHVLEAAFSFGGLSEAVGLANDIIERRRIEPFEDLNEVRNVFFRYSNALDKSKNYIATKSNLFTIHITANSGLGRASAVIAVRRKDGKMEKVAVLGG